MTVDEALVLDNTSDEFDPSKEVGPHKEEIEQDIEHNNQQALMHVGFIN